MKDRFKLRHVIFTLILLLLTAGVGLSQSAISNQNPVLLEVISTQCFNGCESETIRIYADGHFVGESETQEKSKSGRLRKVRIKIEKQLDAEELAELISWAEQPDFINAQPEYIVRTVRDSPDWITIIYHHQRQEKSVKVFNFSRGSDAERGKLPPSLLKLIEWTQNSSF